MKAIIAFLNYTNILNRYLMIISTIFLTICFGGMFMQVIFRYIFNIGLDWLLELIRYTGAIFTLLSFPSLIKKNSNIQIDIFKDNVRSNYYFSNIIDLITLIILVILFYKGIGLVEFGMRQKSSAMQIPMGYLYIFLPISSFLSIIQLLHYSIIQYMEKMKIDYILKEKDLIFDEEEEIEYENVIY